MHEEQIRWLFCTWCKHGVAHVIVTLNPRWNFTPTNQSAASLNATRWMSLNFKIHNFAFEQNTFLLLPRKFTGPSILEELINTTLRCVADSREAPEKRKMKDRPKQREGILRINNPFSYHTLWVRNLFWFSVINFSWELLLTGLSFRGRQTFHFAFFFSV